MADPRFRVRVERLLRGEFRADDLKTLFLYARDRCDGRESVQEIGDFTAHHDERTKGIVTRSTRDWFTTARFMAPRFMPDAQPMNEQRLPQLTRDYLPAAFRKVNKDMLKQKTGLSLAGGRRVLDRLLGRLEENPDGTYRLAKFIPTDELKLFQALCSSLSVTYVFSEDRLFSDFCETLRSNGILHKQEINSFGHTKQPLVLFSVASMHNNDIVMQDKTKIRLRADLSPFDNLIQVFAEVPVAQNIGGGILRLGAPMFGGKVDIEKSFSDELVREKDWNFEIELRDDMRMHPIK